MARFMRTATLPRETCLKNILCQTVVAGDPLGEGQKAAGATGNPGFAVGFEQMTVFGGSLELWGGQNVKIVGHGVGPRFSSYFGRV